MIESIDRVVNAIGGFLYRPYIVPLFLLAAGLYFTIRTGLIQFRLFGESIRVVKEKPKEKGSISSFGALMVSTASRVGTGNIVGVSTAICLGGFGAVFWMWVVALVGGASAFIESALAQVYKKRDADGSSYGGPSYYMEQALHQRWLGIVFAVVLILTYVVGFNMLAAYNLQDAFGGFSFYVKGRTPYIIGAILAVLFAVCVLGGGKRLTNVTGVLVPVMGLLYIVMSLVVVFMNIRIFPSVIANIFRDAFNFKAAFSGFTGSCIMWGIKRGLYSNEAGMGSAPNAAATADVSHPAKQGLVQMLSVFIDTLLICSATAFMCLCSGVVPTPEAAGAAYVQASVQQSLGSFGPIFIAISMCLFAFTTLIGNRISLPLSTRCPLRESCFRIFAITSWTRWPSICGWAISTITGLVTMHGFWRKSTSNWRKSYKRTNRFRAFSRSTRDYPGLITKTLTLIIRLSWSKI